MAWKEINLLGDEPIYNAHPVEFVGPAPFPVGNTLQFFIFGGSVSAWRSVHLVVGNLYEDKRHINLKHGTGGGGVYCKLWKEGDADKFHGNVFWVGDTICCCIKVNPWVVWDQSIQGVFPTVRAIHR